jgi:hypothetical protein
MTPAKTKRWCSIPVSVVVRSSELRWRTSFVVRSSIACSWFHVRGTASADMAQTKTALSDSHLFYNSEKLPNSLMLHSPPIKPQPSTRAVFPLHTLLLP